MSVYQELYKKSTFSLKSSDEGKKICFGVWKDKRNQVFDAKRETLVYEKKGLTTQTYNDKENNRPSKNVLIKWKNDRKNKLIPKKKPPFVVGIVRHKIYSPPFKSFKPTEQKKKILRQSFAPKNYKFKPPESLKINVLKPISENGITSPFTFNSLFLAQHKKISKKEKNAFENVTMRPRAKPLKDSTPNKITLKNTEIKKDCNLNSEDVKKVLPYVDDEAEPPIFGNLNLLKFREKTAETNDVLNGASISDQPSSNQNIKNSKSEDISCASSCLNHQKEQESNITKVNSARKECDFKPLLYSCSQQIQNLLEQKDSRFTELYCNSESNQNQIIKRTSEMPSPNLSRISFTSSDSLKVDKKMMTSMEKSIKENIIDKNTSFECGGSPINDELNITIHVDEGDVIDEEALNYFNLSNIQNVTISENSNFKITATDKIVNEEKGSNVIEDYLLLSEIINSSVNRLSKERELTQNEDIKNEEVNKLNSLNLSSTSTELTDNMKRDQKEKHLKGMETLLEKIELSLNGSKTLKNELLQIESNVSPTSNSYNEENTLIITRDLIISKANMISKVDILNEQDVLKSAEVTINTAVTEKDNVVSAENLINDSTFVLENLSPSNCNTINNVQREIIVPKSSLESDQKQIFEENNLKQLTDDFIELEKLLVHRQLSQNLKNDLTINEVKIKNENNKNQPEIIDLSDSPLKQEKVDYEKNPLLRKLYDEITKNLLLSPQEPLALKSLNSENKYTESELSSTSNESDIIQLVDSPKDEKELSESSTSQDKFSFYNIKYTQQPLSIDRKPMTKNNENKLQNSQVNEIETVNLISDDEEDAESFLSHIKTRFAITTIASPKLNSERIALSSIENVLGSPCVALHSQMQMILKENSPKTQNISNFRVSPCKTPRSSLLAKKNSPATRVVRSMKNLSLQNRKNNPTLSPMKTRNTPRISLFTKNNSPEVHIQTSKNNLEESNNNLIDVSLLDNTENPVCKTPRSQIQPEKNSSLVNDIPIINISLCESPQQQLFIEENSPTSTAANQIRILSLRSRKVSVSPSPKKTRNTSRKALLIKNNLPYENGQTPKNNSDELNTSSLEILQNSICNTPQLQEQSKENNMENLHISKCEISQPQLLVKENLPEISVEASPMKILSLRNRNVDVSPSPKKTRNTSRKALFTKTNLPDVNSQTPKNNLDELNENRIAASLLELEQNSMCSTSRLQKQAKENNIPNLHVSPCDSPVSQSKLLVKKNSPETSTVSSPMRILCLRSRKVDVTPSPKKKTPKKTPREKRTPVK